MLGGSDACHCCFCSPCVIPSPPAFLVGSFAAHLAKNSKWFKLYGQFWQLLRDISLWQCPQYLENKINVNTRDDPCEILPLCIMQVTIMAIIALIETRQDHSVHCRELEDAIQTQGGFLMLTVILHVCLVQFRYLCTCRHHTLLGSLLYM